MSKTSNTSGRIVWHELVTPDPKATLGFYGELLGWTSSEMDMGPAGKYTIFTSNGTDVAGAIAPPPGAKVPPSWLAYSAVDDVDAAVRIATANGGKLMAPATDIPNVGRFAVVVDPQGAVLAPFKAKEAKAELAGPPAVGTFCWDELHTSDPQAAATFYSAIYGYAVQERDMGPMGTYRILKRGDRQAAGVMKAPMPGQPSAWLSYVAVDDVDAKAKRAQQLGGKLVVPPSDIPQIGRFAVVTDAQGATFALFKASPDYAM